MQDEKLINTAMEMLEGRPDLALSAAIQIYNADSEQIELHIEQLQQQLSDLRSDNLIKDRRLESQSKKLEELESISAESDENLIQANEVHSQNLKMTSLVVELRKRVDSSDHKLRAALREVKRLKELQPDKLVKQVKRLKVEKEELSKSKSTFKTMAAKTTKDLENVNRSIVKINKEFNHLEKELAAMKCWCIYEENNNTLMVWPATGYKTVRGKKVPERLLVYMHHDMRSAILSIDTDNEDTLLIQTGFKTLIKEEVKAYAWAWLKKVSDQQGVILDEDFTSCLNGDVSNPFGKVIQLVPDSK